MQNNCTKEVPAKGASFLSAGAIELKKVPYGKMSHWGGYSFFYITGDFLIHLPNPIIKDRGSFMLKVVVNIHPERAKKLGFEEKPWALVRVYAINAAQATVFARLVKPLPDGNPWVEGEGYMYTLLGCY